MSNVLLLTASREPAAEILPSLSLLDHKTRIAPPAPEFVPGRLGAVPRALTGAVAAGQAGSADSATPDVILVDARRDLVRVKDLLGRITRAGVPVLAVISEGAWAAVSAEWGADDVILSSAGPGEVEARIRLAIGRAAALQAPPSDQVRSGELVIDEATYSARVRGVALDLTFKEFELLKYLAQHPRRVFTRSQLLQEVWGYDYFGGTRTVDVHVRRLRAKLGPENEALIGTVRNVGYKFVPASQARRGAAQRASSGSGPGLDADAGANARAHDDGSEGVVPDPRRRAATTRGRKVTSPGNGAGR